MIANYLEKHNPNLTMNKFSFQAAMSDTEPHADNDKSDKRKFSRVKCSLPVVLTAGPNKFWHSTTVNISEGGLFMEPPTLGSSLKVDDRLRIVIEGILADDNLADEDMENYINVRIAHIATQGIGLEFI